MITTRSSSETPAPARESDWIRARRRWLGRVGLSVLLLSPCYWQARIQAGDLSSHIYNSWLAGLVASGHPQGLALKPQTTNVLFDLVLSGLFRAFGAGAAQRIAVSLCVLVFFWGAFAFVCAAGGRRAWNLAPCIVMLAYGWVYHMGFFNFYLALGLCFGAAALAWKPTGRRVATAACLLALAYVAHALPVLWTLALLAYLALARRRSPAGRACLTLGALLAVVAARVVAAQSYSGRWFPSQITGVFGADQIWVFDGTYVFLLLGLVFLWGALLVNRLRAEGARRVFGGVPFQLFVISAGIVLIFPSAVWIPGFRHALAFIAERMSLAVAVCICALLASARPRRVESIAMAGLAAVFFLFVFRDERSLNVFEDRMGGAIAQLAPGQRVVSLVESPDLRVNAVAHIIDRVCLGRCYSYANYEPTTAQFRVRAVAANPIVVSTYADSWALQTGTYTVKPADEPLYAVGLNSGGRFYVRQLRSGAKCGNTSWEVWKPNIQGI